MLVYHSSQTQGLKIIEPRPSTHGQPWVYALKDKNWTAVFIGSNNDFICQTSRLNGLMVLTERFSGALAVAYKNQKGSIYTLNGANFKEGKTSWSPELVSEYPETVLHEDIIDNVLEYLLKLEKSGQIKIYRYPDHPDHIPGDKSDLIDKAVNWTLKGDTHALKSVQIYHPDILEQVTSRLQKHGFHFP